MGYVTLENCTALKDNQGMIIESSGLVSHPGILPKGKEINPYIAEFKLPDLLLAIEKSSKKGNPLHLGRLRVGCGSFFTINLSDLDLPKKMRDYIKDTYPSFTGKAFICPQRDIFAPRTIDLDIASGVMEECSSQQTLGDIYYKCLEEGLGEILFWNGDGVLVFEVSIGRKLAPDGFKSTFSYDPLKMKWLQEKGINPKVLTETCLVDVGAGQDLLSIKGVLQKISGHITFEPENGSIEVMIEVEATLPYPDEKYKLLDWEWAGLGENAFPLNRMIACVCECREEDPFIFYFWNGKFFPQALPEPITARLLTKKANPKFQLVLARMGWLNRV